MSFSANACCLLCSLLTSLHCLEDGQPFPLTDAGLQKKLSQQVAKQIEHIRVFKSKSW